MIDIKLLRENPEAIRTGAAAKNVAVDTEAILKMDTDRRRLIGESEKLKAEQNRASEEVAKEKDATARQSKITALKDTKARIASLEGELKAVETDLNSALRLIPNMPRPDVKIGKDDSENYVLRTHGEPPKFAFPPLDYMALGLKHDIIDTERAAKVAGTRFGYLKGEAALLEFALVQYALNTLVAEGFTPVVPPVMLNEHAMSAMGYMDRGRDEIYHLAEDNLYLTGTSEQSLGAMHMDETFREESLPKRYVGFSTCFRREAGAAGKDTRGILRVHQFDKMEMFSFTKPEDSDQEHEFLLAMIERLWQGLGLPYHVLGTCSGDLGDPAARKFDVETWIPSQSIYRETHSTSSCTDYQARRLNIRVRRDNGGTEFVHTLNGTAVAVQRTIIAILENFQEADGAVCIPPALVPYMAGKTHIGR